MNWAIIASIVVYGVGTVGVAWRLGAVRERALARRTVRYAPPVPPEFRRAPEFGPLLRPWEDIERVRVAILADQLAMRPESPKQRRLRRARQQVGEEERVLYWLQHWQDYTGSLTGRGLAA